MCTWTCYWSRYHPKTNITSWSLVSRVNCGCHPLSGVSVLRGKERHTSNKLHHIWRWCWHPRVNELPLLSTWLIARGFQVVKGSQREVTSSSTVASGKGLRTGETSSSCGWDRLEGHVWPYLVCTVFISARRSWLQCKACGGASSMRQGIMNGQLGTEGHKFRFCESLHFQEGLVCKQKLL